MMPCCRRPDDFGHVVHKKPAAMLRPSNAQDIAKLVQFANRQGVKVAMRGQGHSFFGQTQVAGGVVIDSRSLNAMPSASSNRARAGLRRSALARSGTLS
jgi:FAD/FMN-containing dehydrogenase